MEARELVLAGDIERQEMTHGRTAKMRTNTRRKKGDRFLTTISGNRKNSLESRVARLEEKVLELEEAIDRTSGVVPAHFYGTSKTKPGPREKIADTELFQNRDNIVKWLEEYWPQIVKPLLSAKGPRQVAALLRELAPKPEIRSEWQRRFVGHPAKLFEFLHSDRFRIKPPNKTVLNALRPIDSEQRRRAANRLPTRQIANAMAGVPKLKWRTSLDKCTQNPSAHRVGHPTAQHYRKTFRIAENEGF